MEQITLDERTKELTGTVEQALWTLSILDYRANELKRACETEQDNSRQGSGSMDAGAASQPC